MNTDQLLGELAAHLQHVQADYDRELASGQKDLDAVAEQKRAAETALAQIQAQHEREQANLNDVLAHLGPTADLVSINSMIAKAKGELEALRAESEKVSSALTGLRQQQTDEEHKLQALRNETSRLTGLRSEHESAIGSIRALLRSFG